MNDATEAAAVEDDPDLRLRFERRVAFYGDRAKEATAKAERYEELQQKLDQADKKRRRQKRRRRREASAP